MWPTPPGEGQLASLWGSAGEEGPSFCNSSICSVACSWGRTTCHPPGNMGPTESPLSAQRKELPRCEHLSPPYTGTGTSSSEAFPRMQPWAQRR